MSSFIITKLVQLLFPTSIVFALYLLSRGHDDPGGGFAAGLATSLALVIEAMSFGLARTKARLRRVIRPAFAIGLVIALVTGIAPMLDQLPFLTHREIPLGLSGGEPYWLPTTLLFDVGVYAVVVGTTTVIMAVMAEEGA